MQTIIVELTNGDIKRHRAAVCETSGSNNTLSVYVPGTAVRPRKWIATYSLHNVVWYGPESEWEGE